MADFSHAKALFVDYRHSVSSCHTYRTIKDPNVICILREPHQNWRLYIWTTKSMFSRIGWKFNTIGSIFVSFHSFSPGYVLVISHPALVQSESDQIINHSLHEVNESWYLSCVLRKPVSLFNITDAINIDRKSVV